MSVGALSPEAHETIAEAVIRLGMRSNSGEGGEDPARYGTIKTAPSSKSRLDRFGVTPSYLASAKEIEIKWLRVRNRRGRPLACEQGDQLYRAASILQARDAADIAAAPSRYIFDRGFESLIHDLKQANPEAKVVSNLYRKQVWAQWLRVWPRRTQISFR